MSGARTLRAGTESVQALSGRARSITVGEGRNSLSRYSGYTAISVPAVTINRSHTHRTTPPTPTHTRTRHEQHPHPQTNTSAHQVKGGSREGANVKKKKGAHVKKGNGIKRSTGHTHTQHSTRPPTPTHTHTTRTRPQERLGVRVNPNPNPNYQEQSGCVSRSVLHCRGTLPQEA